VNTCSPAHVHKIVQVPHTASRPVQAYQGRTLGKHLMPTETALRGVPSSMHAPDRGADANAADGKPPWTCFRFASAPTLQRRPCTPQPPASARHAVAGRRAAARRAATSARCGVGATGQLGQLVRACPATGVTANSMKVCHLHIVQEWLASPRARRAGGSHVAGGCTSQSPSYAKRHAPVLACLLIGMYQYWHMKGTV
jgi:hypothetical protein